MNKELLQPFCGTDATRENLLAPFSIGEFTYATDGRCAIRVPRLPDVGEVEKAPKNIEILFAGAKPTQSGYEIPELPFKAAPCKTCEGKGRFIKCFECNGEGEQQCDLGHTHECERCDGSGGIPSDLERGEPCDQCGGAGTIAESIGVKIGPATFSNLFLAKLKPLPDCKVHVLTDTEAALFTFTGGDGLIMPMRV